MLYFFKHLLSFSGLSESNAAFDLFYPWPDIQRYFLLFPLCIINHIHGQLLSLKINVYSDVIKVAHFPFHSKNDLLNKLSYISQARFIKV